MVTKHTSQTAKKLPFSSIICLGDSITCNWTERTYVDFWQQLVDEHFGQNAINITSAGVNGETAQDGYYRHYRDVIQKQPDLVVIMFGHNDADPARHVSPVLFANYTRKIINTIQHFLPSTTIWLASPTGIADSGHEDVYKPYLEQLHIAAKDKNVEYIDMWQCFQNHNLNDIFTDMMESTYIRAAGKDWLHPNQKGHHIIAQHFMNHLLRTL